MTCHHLIGNESGASFLFGPWPGSEGETRSRTAPHVGVRLSTKNIEFSRVTNSTAAYNQSDENTLSKFKIWNNGVVSGGGNKLPLRIPRRWASSWGGAFNGGGARFAIRRDKIKKGDIYM